MGDHQNDSSAENGNAPADDPAEALAAAAVSSRPATATSATAGAGYPPTEQVRYVYRRQPFGFGSAGQTILQIAYVLSWISFVVGVVVAAVLFVPAVLLLLRHNQFGLLVLWVLYGAAGIVMSLAWLIMLSRARYVTLPRGRGQR